LRFFDEYGEARWLFFILLAGSVFYLSTFKIFDSDFGWHLSTGRFIWETKTIPSTDVFSFTICGKQWLTYEWLFQLVIFTIYNYFGFAGVILLKASVCCAVFVLMCGSARKANPLIIFLLYGLAFLVMRDGFRERPQIFTYLFTAYFIYIFRTCLTDSSTQGAGTKAALVSLPLVEVLWVNLHGPVAVTGLIIAFIYLAFSKDTANRLKIYILASIALAMFINPHTYRIFSYLFTFYHDKFNVLIAEHLPPRFMPRFYSFYIFTFIIAAVMLAKREKNWSDNILVLCTMAAAYTAVRNVQVFAIIAAPVAAQKISMLSKHWIGDTDKSEIRTPASARIAVIAGSGAILVLLFAFCAKKTDFENSYRPGTAGYRSQCQYAAEFIRACDAKGFSGNIFNDYQLGGYLIWVLYPKHKVFVDGRLVEYGTDFVYKCFNYYKTPGIMERWDKEYNFSAAVLYKSSEYTSRYFDESKDWALVFWDDNSMVYFKRIPANSRFIEDFWYKYIKPGCSPQNYLSQYPKKEVLKELDRAVLSAPNSKMPGVIRKAVEENM